MAKLNCVSGRDGLTDWKPKIYFTCHPRDFLPHFETVSALFCDAHVCDLYYRDPSENPLTPEEQETLLRNMNLFIVPVTMSLLSKPSAAMDLDIPFARQHDIPVLPLLASPGILPAYRMPNKFGDLPYLDITDYFDSWIPLMDRISFELAHLLPSQGAVFFALTTDNDPLAEGLRCLYGIKGDRSATDAVAPLLRAAKAGDPQAMDQLYRMYDRGNGVPADPRNAMQWAARTGTYYKNQTKIPFWTLHLDYLSHLCYTFLRYGETKFASALGYKLWKLSKRMLGEDDRQTLEYQRLLIDLYLQQDEYLLPREMCMDLCRKTAASEGDDDFATLQDRYRLARLHEQSGEHRECLLLLGEIWRACVAQQKEGHLFSLTVLYRLAQKLSQQDQPEKALQLAEKCYTLCSAQLGHGHPDSIRALQLQATLLSATDKKQEALSLKRIVYNRYRRTLGTLHPDTLGALIYLAMAHSGLGQYTQALHQMKRAHEAYRDFYGPDHPKTDLTQNLYQQIKQKSEQPQ